MAKLTSLTFGVAQALEWEERGGVCGGVGVAIRDREAGERSSVGKGPSEAPAIDQKFMSAAGIKPACPLLAFMCWTNAVDAEERHGGGEDIWDSHLPQNPCPHGPGRDYNTRPPRATQGQRGDREQASAWSKHSDSTACYTLLVAIKRHSALINDNVSNQVAFMAATNETLNCSWLIWMWPGISDSPVP